MRETTMYKYVLPIIWTFYDYIIGKAFPFIIFIGILCLFWIGGFEFPRAPITPFVIIFDIIVTVCIKMLVTLTGQYLKYSNDTDSDGKQRDKLSDAMAAVVMACIVVCIVLAIIFDKL